VGRVGSTLAAAAVAVAVLSAAGPASAASVTPSATDGWQFQERNNAEVRFSPEGLRLTTGPSRDDVNPTDPSLQKGGKAFAFRPEFAGTKLSDLSSLSYKSYVDAGSNPAGTNFTVGINVPLMDPDTHEWITNLVYEPYYSTTPSSVRRGQWQTWDAGTDTRAWWSTTDLSQSTCPASGCYTSLAAWKAKYPDAVIGDGTNREGNTASGQPVNPGISFVVGQRGGPSTWDDFIGFLDDVQINAQSWSFTTGPGASQSVNADTFSANSFEIVSDDGTTPVIGGNATNQRGFATGPDTPPSGATGSYRMKTATFAGAQNRAREGLYLRSAAGRTVAELSALDYWSYESPSNPAVFGPTVSIGVNSPQLPGDQYTGLVFDPGINGFERTSPLTTSSWQHWQPFAPDARWYCTRTFTVGLLNCDRTKKSNSTVTWAQIQTEIPEAVINGDGIQYAVGSTGTGSSYDNIETFLDGLTVGFNGASVTYGFAPGAPLQVCASGCMFTTPAQAVASAQPGDTINIHAGTYPGGFVVDTPSLTITGAGADATEVDGAANAAAIQLGPNADGLTLRDLKVVAGGFQGTNTAAGIRANALDVDDVTLRGLSVTNARYGIDVPLTASADGWTIEDSTLTANNHGARFNGNTTDLVIDGSHFDGNDYGLYSQYRSGTPRTPGVFDQVDVSDSTFDRNSTKGMYLEAVSNATFTRISANANGSVPEVRPSGPPPYPVAGVDINVKYGAFAHVSFIDSSVNDTVGTAMAIKGRNDAPSYSALPGSLDDVRLQGMTISGSLGSGLPEAEGYGVSIGNDVTNARIVGSRIVGNVAGGVDSYVDPGNGNVDARGNWWGCNGGPTAAGCDATSGQVTASSWLQLHLAASPAAILAGTGTSALNASLSNTGGNGGGEAATQFPSTAVAFGSSLGSVPASAPTAGGTAAATLTAGTTVGIADVTAALDAATVHQPVTVYVYIPPTPGGGGGNPPSNNEPSGTPPVNTSEPSSTPAPPSESPTPTPQETRDSAKETLDGAPVKQDRSYDLGPVQVFIPKAGKGHVTPSQTVPIVSGQTVRLDRKGVSQRDDQTLFALTSPTGDSDAKVKQTVKIGNKTYTLPVQELTIKAGSSEPVQLPITKEMRKALKQGKKVTLTVVVTVVDDAGNTTTATKTYTLKAPKKHTGHHRKH
jgi:hypothetical protein